MTAPLRTGPVTPSTSRVPAGVQAQPAAVYSPKPDLSTAQLPAELLYLADRVAALEGLIDKQRDELFALQGDILRQNHVMLQLARVIDRPEIAQRTPPASASTRAGASPPHSGPYAVLKQYGK